MEILERYEDVLRPDWLVPVLFFLLLLLALVRIFGRERLMLITRSVTRPRISRQEVREMSDSFDIGYIGLWVIMVFTLGLFLYQELTIRSISPFGLGHLFTYLVLCGMIALYFVGKFIFIKLSIFLFGEDHGGMEYYYNTFMLFALVGVALLPMVIFRAYVQWYPHIVFIIGGVIVCAALFYQWGRGWIIASANGVKPSYIILYFCVLEILPIAIIAKHSTEFVFDW